MAADFRRYVDLLLKRLDFVNGQLKRNWARINDLIDHHEFFPAPPFYDTALKLYSKEREGILNELEILESVGKPEDILRESWEVRKRQVVNEMGVLCFSASATHPLLWAHYADSHKGVCLEYDSEVRPVKGWKKYHYYPIRYSSGRQLDVLSLGWEQAFFSLIAVKSDDWSYEEEYRLVTLMGPGHQQGTMSSLTGLILGLRVHENSRRSRLKLFEALRGIHRQRPNLRRLRYFCIGKHPTDFRFELIPLRGLDAIETVLQL